MKVLVNSIQKSNGYYSYLLSLLPGLMAPEDIMVREIRPNLVSFFQKLGMRQFIRKSGIKCIIQPAEKKILLSSLPQLIVPLAAERLIVKKALPSTAKLVVSSEKEKEIIVTGYPFLEKNIHLIRSSASPRFQPASWSEKQSLKLQYAQGREYFMASAKGLTEEVFTSLLKAFSAFKNWQRSGMKLVVTGKLLFNQKSEWEEKIKTYRYRDDIVMSEDAVSAEAYHSLLAGAYAYIHLPLEENDVIPVLEAMQCETPCISFVSGIIKEYCDEAALLIETGNYESVSEALVSLYKDETKRNRLVEAGVKQVQQYTREKALQSLSNVLPAGIH